MNKYIDKFQGICGVPITPLKIDETLDKKGYEKIIKHMDKNNNALFCCGSFGEGPTLTKDVKRDALKIALENFKEKPIMFGIFESGVKKTIQSIEIYREII